MQVAERMSEALRFMEDTMKKRVEQPSYWNSAMTLENVYRGASFKNEREIRSGASPVLSVNS